jgi:YesN/AraC family two-component response regulator
MMDNEKISLIIIDDDFSSRNTIKTYLKASHSYFPVNDFSSAVSALEWLKNNRADIAICDMNMPNIDGIEFITQSLRLCPDLHFLAVSAYSDFRYLRECIINSVEDYLLKHELTPWLLINTLDKIKEKYNMKTHSISSASTPHIIEQDVLFSEKYIKELIASESVCFPSDTVIPVIISPDYNSEFFPSYAEFSNNTVFMLRDIICNVLDNKFSYIMHMSNSFQFALILSVDGKGTGRTIQNRIESFFSSVKDKVLRLLNITLTIAWQPKVLNIKDAMKLLGCIQSFREIKLYLSGGNTLTLGEAGTLFSDKYALPSFVKEQIKTLIEMRDFNTLKDLLHGIFGELSEKHISRNKVIETCEKLYNTIFPCLLSLHYHLTEKTVNFGDYEFICQFEKAISNFIDNIVKNVNSEIKPTYSTAVSRAVFWIEEHYKEEISLEICAGEVGLSYTHLSRIFKKETSFSFSEYLNRFRLSRAKILLAEKRLPIKQIIEEAGFTSYNYFFKVFKDVEGITPLEVTVKYPPSGNKREGGHNTP